ncbi:glycosyltransferase family 61 protein [Hoylesella timonensis]|uniref:Glycosyltransferase 61 catalytic domain-containing protein n=1 Tax=Hoylesella timonensis S9-PR14 TaxID=1401062 RepID=A0A098YSV2_9BACT|nr:glycosyltransferase 61 family protein [Hoylesella timonensis]KGI22382.1 hypothetical protein HMPREF9304_04910 [Hoylesella timonensis S9-PR14]
MSLAVQKIESGYILPYRKGKGEGGVLTSSLEFVKNSTLHEEFTDGAYEFDKRNVVQVTEPVIFIGTLISVYGHAITDNLKKVWWLKSQEAMELLKSGIKIVYITFQGKPLESYAKELLQLADVNISSLVEIVSVTRFQSIYIPEDSIKIIGNSERIFFPPFATLIFRIKQSVEHQGGGDVYEKIYLSRKELHDKKDFGEEAIENLFAMHGYKVIYPEKLSIVEQIWIVSHCKEFVATEGSISHQAIFCSQATKVVILKKANYINSYQNMIHNLIQANAVYISVHHSIGRKDAWKGPFYLCITRDLGKYFHKEVVDLYFLRISWYKYCLRYLIMRTRLGQALKIFHCI